MKTVGLSLIFLFSLISTGALALSPQLNNSYSRVTSNLEAGYACVDGRCTASAQKSNLIKMCEAMKSRAAWAKDWKCVNAAIYDDGRERSTIQSLREKDPASLTPKEEAILVAANKVGAIKFCSKAIAMNAFVIMYKGQPAVVTSSHSLVDDKTGKLKCSESDLRDGIDYYRNISYFQGRDNEDYALKKTQLIFPPINLENVLGKPIKQGNPNDFLIFPLKDNITNDKMADGRRRGYFKPSQDNNHQGHAVLLGVAPDVQNGIPMLVQNECDYKIQGDLIKHNCDTVAGSSGSFLGVYENGEILMRGVHNSSVAGNESLPGDMRTMSHDWNTGVNSERIFGQ